MHGQSIRKPLDGDLTSWRLIRDRVHAVRLIRSLVRSKFVVFIWHRLLHLLRDRHEGFAPAEIWAALDVTKQGAAHILAPLLKAKLVKRIGTRKTGCYVLG